MKIQHSIEIDRSPEEVWPWLDEPERQKQWMKGVLDNETTHDTPDKIGSTFRMRVKEGKRVSEYDGTVTAYDRPRHLAVRLTGGCLPQDQAMEVDYRLTDLGGRTRVDYEARTETSGLLMALFGWLFRLMAKAMIKGFFRRLKEVAESDRAAPVPERA